MNVRVDTALTAIYDSTGVSASLERELARRPISFLEVDGHMLKKLLRIAGVGLAVLVVAAGVGLFLVYRASKQVPEFYQAALDEVPVVQQADAGDQLEQEVLHLHNSVQEEGVWEASFTDDELNGWLAVDLPAKFSQALPKGVSDPRVAIAPKQIQVACHYKDKRVDSVVSLAIEAKLTDEPNVIAIHIQHVRAGWVPLPFKKFLDRISKAAEQADIPIEWSEKDGKTVALVTIPEQHERYRFKSIHVDTVEMRKGELFLSGRTIAAGSEVAKSHVQPESSFDSPNRTIQR